ncbi:hypothetical protein ASG22_17040 [Chryseobacterium sp. Leaf405]|uniref:hypothetical protein n=1 Tax=Chryseobacterium sp. Leaf405 TaxID=1736367 RepID=UPI0006F4782B|nr:hypothetical protein [Chryseobacterium sp. Leaf405]KQT20679.1 hypothetical protein ASG22_17040 [Chryseobacterium sp. Leaf405]
MPIYFTPDGRLISWYNEIAINKYRPLLSIELIKKFGKGNYSLDEMKNILFFSLDWFEEKFLEVIRSQTDSAFYLGLFFLHDYSCDFHSENPNYSPIAQMRNQDFAVYRRVLKLCLTQACDLELNSHRHGSEHYLKEKELIIDELLYLGDFMFTISNLLAEQHLVEDCIDLKFTDEDLFYFDHKHHYEMIFKEFGTMHPEHLKEAIIDQNHFNEFKNAFKKCFETDFNNIPATLQEIHNSLEGGQYSFIEWKYFAINLNHFFQVPIETGNIIFDGLTLSKDNKMTIDEEVYKPQLINRYLYRPILVWNVDGKDYAIVGRQSFNESMVSLSTNAFGWDKYPIEWKSTCFDNYIKSVYIKNDKILEDAIEEILKANNIIYDRNITKLKKWNNRNINIHNDDCGELDFVFILNNKIYIADSKHLISRYDMNNWKNDYAYFETNKKNYNKTMKRKLDFLSSNKDALQEHFQVHLNNRLYEFGESNLEGIFIINTPTFIMYNNTYRLYTLKWFKEVVENTFQDKTFTVVIDEDDHMKMINVGYPYFRKPDYKVFDFDIEE